MDKNTLPPDAGAVDDAPPLHAQYLPSDARLSLPFPDAPVGIGGWLLLVIFQLGANGFTIIKDLASYALSDWTEFFANVSAEFSFFSIAAVISVSAEVAGGFLAVTGLVLLFRKSRFAPRLLIAFYLARLTGNVTDGVLEWVEPSEMSRIFSDPRMHLTVLLPFLIGVPLLMIAYLLRSKRVANTFKARQVQTDAQMSGVFS